MWGIPELDFLIHIHPHIPAWFIGVLLSFGGCCLSNFGVNLQKLTHLQLEASISKANKDTIRNSAGNNSGDEDEDEEDDENSSVFAEPLWIFGLFCVIFGSVLDLISFGFADMSLLAPLGAMTLVINMATAVWFLKEKLSKKDVLHTIIILLGTLLAVSFGSKAAPKYTLDMLFGMYMTKVFFVFECAYIGLLVCALLLLRRIHNVRENNQSFAQKKRETLDDLSLPSSDEDADADANTSEQTNIGIDSGLGGSYQNSGDGDPRQPAADTREQDDNDASSFLLEQGTRMESLLYPTIAGSFGAHSVLCAKSVAEIVRPIIDYISSSSTVGVSVSEGIDAVYAPLTNVFTYVLFVCMLGFLVLQVRFLNMGLAKADALLVVPIYQVSWVLMNCIVGFTYFQDYQAMSTFQIVMFSLAVFVILMGVYLLSTRPLTPHSMLLEEAMRDTEYNDLDINLRYECEYDYDEDEDDAQMDKEDAEAERAKEGGKHEEGSGSGVKGRDDGYDKGGIYVGGKDQMKNEREGHRVTRTERSTSTNTSEEARDEKIHGTDHDRDTGRGRRQSMAKDGMRQRLNSRTNTRGSDHDHGIDARADLQRTVRCVDGNASMNDKRTNDVLQASSYQSASIAGKGHGGAAITDDNVSVPSKTDDGEKDAEEPHKHQHTDKGESNSGTGLNNTESETVGTGQRTVVRDAHTDTNAVADTNHSADDEERDDGREEEAPCWRRYLCFFFNKRRKGYYAQRIQLMVHLIKLGMGAGMFSIPYLFHRLGIMMASFMVCVTLLMCSLSLRLILRTQQQVNFYTRFDFLHDAIKGKKNNGFVAMSKLVRLILGRNATRLYHSLIIITLFTVLLSYTAATATMLNMVELDVTHHGIAWTFICFIILFPFAFSTRLNGLSGFMALMSFLGVFTATLTVITTCLWGAYKHHYHLDLMTQIYHSSGLVHISNWEFLTDLIDSFGVLMFSVGLIPLFCTFIIGQGIDYLQNVHKQKRREKRRRNHRRSRFHRLRDVNWDRIACSYSEMNYHINCIQSTADRSLSLLAILYIGLGVWCMALFDHFNVSLPPFLLTVLPPGSPISKWMLLFFAFTLLFSLPLSFVPMLNIIEYIVFKIFPLPAYSTAGTASATPSLHSHSHSHPHAHSHGHYSNYSNDAYINNHSQQQQHHQHSLHGNGISSGYYDNVGSFSSSSSSNTPLIRVHSSLYSPAPIPELSAGPPSATAPLLASSLAASASGEEFKFANFRYHHNDHGKLSSSQHRHALSDDTSLYNAQTRVSQQYNHNHIHNHSHSHSHSHNHNDSHTHNYNYNHNHNHSQNDVSRLGQHNHHYHNQFNLQQNQHFVPVNQYAYGSVDYHHGRGTPRSTRLIRSISRASMNIQRDIKRMWKTQSRRKGKRGLLRVGILGFAAGCSTLLNSPSFPLALGKLMAIVGLFGIIGIVLVYPAVLYLKCCSMYNFTSNENSGSTGGGGGVNDDDGDDHSNGFGGNGQSDGGIATTLIPHPQSPFHSQRSRKSQPLSSPSLVSSLSSSSSSSSSSRNGLIATNSDAAASSSSTARASAAGSVTRRVGDPTKEQELLVPLVPFYATLHSIWWVVSRVCLGLLGLFARVFKQREEETDAPCTTEIEMDVMLRRSFNNSNTKHNGEGSRGGDSVITISAKKKNKNRGKGEGEGKSDVDQPLHLHMNDSTAVKVFLISYIVASVCLFFLAVYVYIVQ